MRLRNKAAIVLLTAALFAFTGCENGEKVIYTDDNIKVLKSGAEMQVFDLISGTTHDLTIQRKPRTAGVSMATTTADTDTLTIKAARDLIIIEEKAAGTTIYIHGAR